MPFTTDRESGVDRDIIMDSAKDALKTSFIAQDKSNKALAENTALLNDNREAVRKNYLEQKNLKSIGPLTAEQSARLVELKKDYKDLHKELLKVKNVNKELKKSNDEVVKSFQDTHDALEDAKVMSKDFSTKFKMDQVFKAAKIAGRDLKKEFPDLIKAVKNLTQGNISAASSQAELANLIKSLSKDASVQSFNLRELSKSTSKYLSSVAFGFESAKSASKEFKKQAAGMAIGSKAKKDALALANSYEAVAEGLKRLGPLGQKYVQQIQAATSSVDLDKIAKKMKKELSLEKVNPFDDIVAENPLEKSFKEGRKEIENYAKALKGLPLAGVAVGVYALAKGINAMNNNVTSAIIKYKGLKQEMAVTASMSKRGLYPETIGELVKMGKTLNLTREQTMQMGKAMADAAQFGVGYKTVNDIATNLQKTLGKMDPSILKEAVDLIKQLPKQQMDVVINGKGSFDDEAGLIATMWESGKLEKLIELDASGAFGAKDLAKQGFTEDDKGAIRAEQTIESIKDNMKASASDLAGSGTMYTAEIAKQITEIGGTITSAAFGLGAIHKSLGYILAAQGFQAVGVDKMIGKAIPSITKLFSKKAAETIANASAKVAVDVGSKVMPSLASGAGPGVTQILSTLGYGSGVPTGLGTTGLAVPSAVAPIGVGTGVGSGVGSHGLVTGVSGALTSGMGWGTMMGMTPGALLTGGAGMGAAVGAGGLISGTAVGGYYAGKGINTLGNKMVQGDVEGAITGKSNFDDYLLPFLTTSKDVKVAQDKLNTSTLRYTKNLKKTDKLEKTRTSTIAESWKSVQVFKNELDKVKTLANVGNVLRDTAKSEIEMMGNLGGTLEGYSESVKKSLDGSTRAYSMQSKELTRMRKAAIEDENLSEADRMMVLAKITQQEAAISSEWINSLVATIGEYDKIPNTIANNLKIGMNTIKSEILSSAKFGTFTELLNSAAENVSLALDNLSLALDETSRETIVANDKIEEVGKNKGGTETYSTYDKTAKKLEELGIATKSIDFKKAGNDIRNQSIDNKKQAEDMLSKLEAEKIRNISSVTTEDELKAKIKPIASGRLEGASSSSRGGNAVSQEERNSMQRQAQDRMFSKLAKDEIEKNKNKGGLYKQIGEQTEVYLALLEKQNKLTDNELSQDVLKAEKIKTLTDMIKESRDLSNKEVSLIDKKKSALNEYLEANKDIIKKQSDSIAKLQVQAKQWQGIKKATEILNQSMQAVIESIDKSPLVQLWASLQKQVEANAVYQERIGRGVSNVRDQVGLQLDKYKATADAITKTDVKLKDIGNKVDRETAAWIENGNKFDDLVKNISDVDAKELGKKFQEANSEYTQALQDSVKASRKVSVNPSDANARSEATIAQKKLEEVYTVWKTYYDKIASKSSANASKQYIEYEKHRKNMEELGKQKVNAEEKYGKEASQANAKDISDVTKKYEAEAKAASELLGGLDKTEKQLVALKDKANTLNLSAIAAVASQGKYSDTLRDRITKENEMRSELQKTSDLLDTMADKVDLSSTMRNLKMQSEYASQSLDLLSLSLNSKEIANAGEALVKATLEEEEKRVAGVKKAGMQAVADQEKILEEMKSKLGKTDSEGKPLVTKDMVESQEQEVKRRYAKQGLDNARTEYQLKTKVGEAVKKEYDSQRKIIDLKEQALQTELDIMESIGGSFEQIFDIEVGIVDLARQRAAIANSEVDRIQKLHDEGKASDEALSNARIAARKAEGEVLKKQMGAQRSAMEKLLGGMLTTFQQVGAFKGPNRASKFGAGYLVEGDPESGTIYQKGGKATADAKAQGITGYDSRVNKANIAETKGRANSKPASRIGGGTGSVTDFVKDANAINANQDAKAQGTTTTGKPGTTPVKTEATVATENKLINALDNLTSVVTKAFGVEVKTLKVARADLKQGVTDIKTNMKNSDVTALNAEQVSKNSSITKKDQKASDDNTVATYDNTDAQSGKKDVKSKDNEDKTARSDANKSADGVAGKKDESKTAGGDITLKRNARGQATRKFVTQGSFSTTGKHPLGNNIDLGKGVDKKFSGGDLEGNKKSQKEIEKQTKSWIAGYKKEKEAFSGLDTAIAAEQTAAEKQANVSAGIADEKLRTWLQLGQSMIDQKKAIDSETDVSEKAEKLKKLQLTKNDFKKARSEFIKARNKSELDQVKAKTGDAHYEGGGQLGKMKEIRQQIADVQKQIRSEKAGKYNAEGEIVKSDPKVLKQLEEKLEKLGDDYIKASDKFNNAVKPSKSDERDRLARTIISLEDAINEQKKPYDKNIKALRELEKTMADAERVKSETIKAGIDTDNADEDAAYQQSKENYEKTSGVSFNKAFDTNTRELAKLKAAIAPVDDMKNELADKKKQYGEIAPQKQKVSTIDPVKKVAELDKQKQDILNEMERRDEMVSEMERQRIENKAKADEKLKKAEERFLNAYVAGIDKDKQKKNPEDERIRQLKIKNEYSDALDNLHNAQGNVKSVSEGSKTNIDVLQEKRNAQQKLIDKQQTKVEVLGDKSKARKGADPLVEAQLTEGKGKLSEYKKGLEDIDKQIKKIDKDQNALTQNDRDRIKNIERERDRYQKLIDDKEKASDQAKEDAATKPLEEDYKKKDAEVKKLGNVDLEKEKSDLAVYQEQRKANPQDEVLGQKEDSQRAKVADIEKKLKEKEDAKKALDAQKQKNSIVKDIKAKDKKIVSMGSRKTYEDELDNIKREKETITAGIKDKKDKSKQYSKDKADYESEGKEIEKDEQLAASGLPTKDWVRDEKNPGKLKSSDSDLTLDEYISNRKKEHAEKKKTLDSTKKYENVNVESDSARLAKLDSKEVNAKRNIDLIDAEQKEADNLKGKLTKLNAPAQKPVNTLPLDKAMEIRDKNPLTSTYTNPLIKGISNEDVAKEVNAKVASGVKPEVKPEATKPKETAKPETTVVSKTDQQIGTLGDSAEKASASLLKLADAGKSDEQLKAEKTSRLSNKLGIDSTTKGEPAFKVDYTGMSQDEIIGEKIDAANASSPKSEFSKGGYTGAGSKMQPAGVVHAGEYVIPKRMVEDNPDLISGIEAGRKTGQIDLPGYAGGGGVADLVKSGFNMTKVLSDANTDVGALMKTTKNINKVGSFSPKNLTKDLPLPDFSKDLKTNVFNAGKGFIDTASNVKSTADVLGLGANVVGDLAGVTKVGGAATAMGGAMGAVSKVAAPVAAGAVIFDGLDTVLRDKDGNINLPTSGKELGNRLGDAGEKSIRRGESGIIAGFNEGATHPVKTLLGAGKVTSDIFGEWGSNKEKEANIKKMQDKLIAKQVKDGQSYKAAEQVFGKDPTAKGTVHKGEYVMPEWQVKENPELVSSIETSRATGDNTGLKPFALGGYVSGGNVLGAGPSSMNAANNNQNASADAASSKAVAQKVDINVFVKFDNEMFKQEVIKIVTDATTATQVVSKGLAIN